MNGFQVRKFVAPHQAIRIGFFLVYTLWFIPVEVFSVWFLFCAVTRVGSSLALAGCFLGILPAALYLRFQQKPYNHRWRYASLSMALLVIGMIAGILFSAPSGKTASNSAVSQHWTHEEQFQRFSIVNLIPETEQVNLGFMILPYMDPYLTRKQAQRVSTFTLALYQEMDRDPDFWQMGSAMGGAYADFLSLPFETGHYFLYIPHNRPNENLPVIVFLHGSFGNFKAYTWAWAKFAEAHGFIIIAPSFGFGDWRQPGGMQTALAALEDAKRWAQIDESRIYLAGLSNGGLGVSLLAQEAPQQFKGLIFLSPVMVTEIVDQPAFQHAWKGRSVLVITGEADERIPLSYVEERVRRLKDGGVSVTYITYPGEDHFLFFSQLSKVLGDIFDWIK